MNPSNSIFKLISFFLFTTSLTFGQNYYNKSYFNSFENKGSVFNKLQDQNSLLGITNLDNNSNTYFIQLIKMNPAGDTIWSKSFGSNNGISIRNILPKSDTGFYLLTTVNDFSYKSVELIDMDKNGNILWNKGIKGIRVKDIIQCENKGLLIGGVVDSLTNDGIFDIGIVKIDSLGQQIWNRRIYSFYTDGAEKIFINQSGYLIFGNTGSWGANPPVGAILQLDTSGNLISQKILGEPWLDTTVISDVDRTPNNEFIVSGAKLIKCDSIGNVIWIKSYPFWVMELAIAASGGFSASIKPNPIFNPTSWNYGFAKFDNNGNYFYGKSLKKNNYIYNISCEQNQNMRLMCDYNPIDTTSYLSYLFSDSILNSTCILDSQMHYLEYPKNINNYTIYFTCNHTDSISSYSENVFSMNHIPTFSQDPCTLTNSNIKTKIDNIKLYPNPTKYELIIENNNLEGVLSIYSLDGQTILKKNLKTNYNKIDVSSLSTGIYILQYKNGKELLSKKIIIE